MVMKFLSVFIITLITLILVHEFGHYIVARALNIKILRFSIGFGKPLWRWHDARGTEFVLAWGLLGGYVKLLDEREGKVSEADIPFAFNRQSLIRRAMVIFAGPGINILFALMVYYIVFCIGIIRPIPLIGQVLPNSILAQALVEPGAEIIRIDNTPVYHWRDIAVELLRHYQQSQALTLSVKTETAKYQDYQLDLSRWRLDGLHPDLFTSLGMIPYLPTQPLIISHVIANSPAAKAGVLPHDRIIAIDGKTIKDALLLKQMIDKKMGAPIKLTVSRNHQSVELTVHIKTHKIWYFIQKPVFGIVLEQVAWPTDRLRLFKGTLLDGWELALSATLKGSLINILVLKKLVMQDISVDSLGGPISMFEGTIAAVKEGWVYYLDFLALLSLSLGIFNLLPIPGLDGSQLMLLVIEKVQGKPVSIPLQVLLYKLGMTVLVILMVQTFVNDILRLL